MKKKLKNVFVLIICIAITMPLLAGNIISIIGLSLPLPIMPSVYFSTGDSLKNVHTSRTIKELEVANMYFSYRYSYVEDIISPIQISYQVKYEGGGSLKRGELIKHKEDQGDYDGGNFFVEFNQIEDMVIERKFSLRGYDSWFALRVHVEIIDDRPYPEAEVSPHIQANYIGVEPNKGYVYKYTGERIYEPLLMLMDGNRILSENIIACTMAYPEIYTIDEWKYNKDTNMHERITELEPVDEIREVGKYRVTYRIAVDELPDKYRKLFRAHYVTTFYRINVTVIE